MNKTTETARRITLLKGKKIADNNLVFCFVD